MATHPLGPGKTNGSVNLPVDTWRQFTRLAYVSNQSASERLRTLVEFDLAAARARGVQLVHDARQLVLPLAACLVLALGALGFLATVTAAVLGDAELRRPTIRRCAASFRGLKTSARQRDDVAA